MFKKYPHGLSPVDSKSGVKIQEPYEVLAKCLYYDPFSFIFGQVPKILQMLCQSFNFKSISLLSTTRMLNLT